MGNARENPRISLMDHEVARMLQRHPNGRNTLSKLKSTKSLRNIPNGLKGFRNIPNGLESLRKLPRRLRSSTNSPVSHKTEKFSPRIIRDSLMGPRHQDNSLKGCKERVSPRSRELPRKLSMSRDDTNSTMSHKREEEFSPGKLHTINRSP